MDWPRTYLTADGLVVYEFDSDLRGRVVFCVNLNRALTHWYQLGTVLREAGALPRHEPAETLSDE